MIQRSHDNGGPRYAGLILLVAAVVAVAWLASSAIRTSGVLEESATAVEELSPGDCFSYPGDGVTPESVQVENCQEVHYGEVFGETRQGAETECEDTFARYTGLDYWESEYIMGFLEAGDDRLLCYLYLPEDSSGSARG